MKSLISFLLLICFSVFAEENIDLKSAQFMTTQEKEQFKSRVSSRKNLALKAGPSFSRARIEADYNTEEHLTGLGAHTHFGYNWVQFEFNLSSYLFFGKIDGLVYNINGTDVIASGSFRNVLFSPQIKYISEWGPRAAWHYYVSGGPAWGLQSMRLAPFVDRGGVLRNHFRVNYESRGFVAGIGIQEILPFKEMHPAYVEILYSYLKAHKVNLVDTSDFTAVETVYHSNKNFKIFDSTFILSIGITFF